MATENTHPGEILRAVRTAAGVSLARLASLTNYSKPYLGHIETGVKPVLIEHAAAYDKTLGTGGLLVDLVTACQDGDDVRRRVVLSALGTVATLGVADLRAISESLRQSLLSAFGDGDWVEIAQEYGCRFMSDPPEVFQTALTGDLMVLRQAVVERGDRIAHIAAPRLMILYGMVTANLGDAAGAERWYRAARCAADLTGDGALRQWVRAKEAFRRGYEGATPYEILALTAGVADVEAYLARAQAHARLGDTASALAALDDARRAHETTDHGETTIYAVPPWRMALAAGYVFSLLGDVNRSEEELAAVAPPKSVKRWESQLEMQRAVSLTRSGDHLNGRTIARKVVCGLPRDRRGMVLAEMYREALSPRP